MSDLTSIDIGILVLCFASVLIGVYRGILRETLTIVTWIIASVVAFMYGKNAAALFTFADSETTRNLLGMSSVFVLVVFVGFIVKFAVCKAFSIGGPSPLDRFLGSLFGFARALVIVVAVMLVVAEPVKQQTWYKDSKLIPKLDNVVAIIDKNAPKDWKTDLNKEIEQLVPSKASPKASDTNAESADSDTKVPPMLPSSPEALQHNADEFVDVPPASKSQ